MCPAMFVHMTTRTNDTFAIRLRLARQRAGLSQAAVARAAGVDVKTVVRVEMGATQPRIDTADALCEAVGSSFGELMAKTSRAGKTSGKGAGAASSGG